MIIFQEALEVQTVDLDRPQRPPRTRTRPDTQGGTCTCLAPDFVPCDKGNGNRYLYL